MGEEGFETTPKNRQKAAILEDTGSKTGNIREQNRDYEPSENACGLPQTTPACPQPTDPDLAQVLAAWPTLPAPLRAAVMALVGTVTP